MKTIFPSIKKGTWRGVIAGVGYNTFFFISALIFLTFLKDIALENFYILFGISFLIFNLIFFTILHKAKIIDPWNRVETLFFFISSTATCSAIAAIWLPYKELGDFLLFIALLFMLFVATSKYLTWKPKRKLAQQ